MKLTNGPPAAALDLCCRCVLGDEAGPVESLQVEVCGFRGDPASELDGRGILEVDGC